LMHASCGGIGSGVVPPKPRSGEGGPTLSANLRQALASLAATAGRPGQASLREVVRRSRKGDGGPPAISSHLRASAGKPIAAVDVGLGVVFPFGTTCFARRWWHRIQSLRHFVEISRRSKNLDCFSARPAFGRHFRSLIPRPFRRG
jgi:hypothetical protein